MAARKQMSGDCQSPKPASTKIMDETDITKEEMEMSLEDKMDYIDQEIRKLHMFCVSAGYNSSQVEKFAEPFFETVKSVKRERFLKRSIKFSIFLAVIAVLYHFDPAYRFMCAVSRKGAISILPIWDWSKLYDNECLIDNPLFTESSVKSEDCVICESLTDIDIVSNIPENEFMTYLHRFLPLVVDDGMRDWPLEQISSISKLAEVYHDTPGLNDHSSCMYISNLQGQFKDSQSLLRDVQRRGTTHFFAHWENCFIESAKAFRRLFKRPYFFPSIIQLDINNWVFISSKFTGKKPKQIEMGVPVQVLVQVKGVMEVILKPRETCSKICKESSFLLQEGQMFVMSSILWVLEYIPQGDGESIAIGFGGSI